MVKFSISYKILCIVSLLHVCSCKTKEKLVYFQNQTDSLVTSAHFTPTFQVDDFLDIQITGEDPEALVAFNLPATQAQNMSGYIQGNVSKNGYLVDANGSINLPIIGQFQLAGLNRMDATQQLQEKLKLFIKNPVVQIQIQNFKITVLGEVRSPGTYKIPNERITILEAIGLSGDLKPTGLRKNVLVVREENNQKVEYRLDLTSKNIFNSPAYYLQQNDVIYVEPNLSAQTEATLWRSNGGLFVSLTSIIITTIALITR